MNLHANAPFGPKKRLTMVRRVSERTVCKWVGRYRHEGEPDLRDRSSEPRSGPHRTPVARVEAIAALHWVRMTGPEIAECLGMALSTVSLVLKRIGLGKLSRLEALSHPTATSKLTLGS